MTAYSLAFAQFPRQCMMQVHAISLFPLSHQVPPLDALLVFRVCLRFMLVRSWYGYYPVVKRAMPSVVCPVLFAHWIKCRCPYKSNSSPNTSGNEIPPWWSSFCKPSSAVKTKTKHAAIPQRMRKRCSGMTRKVRCPSRFIIFFLLTPRIRIPAALCLWRRYE